MTRESKPDPMIGRKIRGAYEIRRLIGEGGMGCVYEGWQVMLERSVAIKVMSAEHARNPGAAEYFLREARSVSRLRHPNVIQVLDFGEEDGTTFIVMEFVPGKPLSRVLEAEPMAAGRIRDIMEQALSGLEEAHANQIIHRDLKPDNLMIERRRDGRDLVKILDFGIAHAQGPNVQAGPMTMQGMIVGTPHYMSPEQARGQKVDGRSDLFSLGVILYELLTDELPFVGQSVPEILTAVLRDPVVPPSVRVRERAIDPQLEAICLRALHKDPALRYQDAAAMRAALTSLKLAPAPAPRRLETPLEPTPAAPAPTVQAKPLAPTEAQDAPARGALGGLNMGALRAELVGERRQGVVLALHQRASGGAVDVEELAALYGQIDDLFGRLATQLDAVSPGRQGSWSTLIFGAGESGRGAGLRAAQAARALHETLARLAPAGITFGAAVADGALLCPGGDVRRASGPAIDQAMEGARLAPAGETLALGEALAAELDASVELRDSPIAGAKRLGAAREQRAAPAREGALGHAALLERDAEIAALLGAVGRLGRGQGGALVVHGAPGVGISAVLAELGAIASQRQAQVLRASMRLPQQLGVQDVLRQWLCELGRQRGGSAGEVPRALEGVGLPDAMRGMLERHAAQRELELVMGADSSAGSSAERVLHGAMRQLARALAKRKPLVVVIDDAERLDGPLLDLVHVWAMLGAELPILLAVGLRAAQPPARLDAGIELLPLAPLSEAGALTYLRLHAPPALSEGARKKLVALSGGSPRLLADLAAHMQRHPDTELDELGRGMWGARELRDMLALRLYARPRAEQYTLGLLAVLGPGARRSAVRALAQPDWEADRSLDAAMADGLLSAQAVGEDEALYYSPPALGEVIYETLAMKGRLKVHGQAAAYYAAMRQPAPDELRSWSRQLERGGDVAGALDVLDRLIAVELRAGQAALVEADERLALQLMSGQPEVSADALAARQLRIAAALHAQGRAQDALAVCGKLERRAQALGDGMRREVTLMRATCWLEEEDPEPLEAMLQRVVQAQRGDGAQDAPWLKARALYLLAAVQDKLGKRAQAADALLDAIDVVQDARLDAAAVERVWLGASILWEPLWLLARLKLAQRDMASAEQVARMGLGVAQEASELRGQVMLHDLLGQIAAMSGHIEQARRAMDDALGLARKTSDLRLCARVQHNIGALQLGLGEQEQARLSLEASLEQARAIDWREGVAMATARLQSLA